MVVLNPPGTSTSPLKNPACAAFSHREVSGDRYSAQWVSESFERHGVRYVPSEKNRSEIYLEFLPALTSGQIEQLDNERMKQQFAGLQRRTTLGGRDSVDHGIGGHDDLSNCAAGALCKVLESNSSGMLGLLDYGKDLESGKRKLPASVDEKLVRHDGYAAIKKAEVRPTCPKCSRLAQRLAVAGGWWCNTCDVSMDSEGKLTVVEEELGCKPGCPGFVKQWAGGRVFCGNCHGFYTPRPKVVGVGRGDYDKGVGRSRWGASASSPCAVVVANSHGNRAGDFDERRNEGCVSEVRQQWTVAKNHQWQKMCPMWSSGSGFASNCYARPRSQKRRLAWGLATRTRKLAPFFSCPENGVRAHWCRAVRR
jgi:hypothetical protein